MAREKYPNDVMSGKFGCKFVDHSDGSAQTGPFHLLQVNEDATISTLTDSNGNDVLSKYNLSGRTLKAGVIITPRPLDGVFQDVATSAGSLIAFYADDA